LHLGIIGPTHWQKNCKMLRMKEKKYLEETRKLAAVVKKLGFDIVVNPHFGGISHAFAAEFRRLEGGVIGIIPKQDNEFGIDYLDQGVCSSTVDCGSWRNYAEKFNEECTAILCLGYSCGVLNEIAFSKWFGLKDGKPKKIFVVKEFVSACLPEESIKGLDVKYVPLKAVGKKLKGLGK